MTYICFEIVNTIIDRSICTTFYIYTDYVALINSISKYHLVFKADNFDKFQGTIENYSHSYKKTMCHHHHALMFI
jgi:hypothetical protein